MAFAIHFYHSLVVQKCETSGQDIEQLESMKRDLDTATVKVNMFWKHEKIVVKQREMWHFNNYRDNCWLRTMWGDILAYLANPEDLILSSRVFIGRPCFDGFRQWRPICHRHLKSHCLLYIIIISCDIFMSLWIYDFILCWRARRRYRLETTTHYIIFIIELKSDTYFLRLVKYEIEIIYVGQ